MKGTKKKRPKKSRKRTFKNLPFTNRHNKKPNKTIRIDTFLVKKLQTEIKKMTTDTINIRLCPVKCKKRKRIKKVKCNRPIRVAIIDFKEEQFRGLSATNHFQSTPAQNTSLSRSNMYMISNRSESATIEAQIEISPNNRDFTVDTPSIIIKPKQNNVVIPLRFAKFTRISYRTTEEGTTASMNLFYQSQEQLTKKCRKEQAAS